MAERDQAIRDLTSMTSPLERQRPSMPKTEAFMTAQRKGMPGYVGPQEISPVLQELRTAEETAATKAGESEIAVEEEKRKERGIEAGMKRGLVERQATEIKAMPERQQLMAKREELANAAFAPTRDNFNDLAGLFSIIGVIGVAMGGGGKGAALQAMNAMNGMVEGYRRGRADLYKQQLTEFDRSVKTMQQQISTLEKAYTEAMNLKALDRQAGELRIQELLAASDSPVLKAMRARQGDVAALNLIRNTVKDVSTVATMQNTLQAAADARAAKAAERAAAAAQKNIQLVQTPQGLRTVDIGTVPRATAEEMEKATPFKGGGQQTRQGQNALTFASRVFGNVQNAANDFVNTVLLPASVEIPVFSGLLNTERRTALGSLQSLAARKITPKENRAFQQVSDQLGSALAGMEAQGLASGVTKAKIDAFNSLRPGPGDNAINMALYIARVKQEIETGISVHQEMPGATEGQKEKTKAILANINQVVPFDVNDVLQVMRMKKQTLGANMQQLVKQKPLASNLQFEGVSASGEVEDSTNRYSDPEKESRYQEWLARQPK
jgi:hypothetical protein